MVHCLHAHAHVQAIMMRKSLAAGMRNAILRNHIKLKTQKREVNKMETWKRKSY